MLSRFWDFMNEHGREAAEHQPLIDLANELLLEELPSAGNWLYDWEIPGWNALYMLTAIKWGDFFGTKSPRQMQYDPKDVTLHFDEQEFRDLIMLKPARGMLTYMWTMYDEDCIAQPSSKATRIVSFICNELNALHDDEEMRSNPGAAAILIARDKRLDAYVFPKNWRDIVEAVYWELKKMTAKEKAAKDLPHVLREFAGLLGWEAVNREVEKMGSLY